MVPGEAVGMRRIVYGLSAGRNKASVSMRFTQQDLKPFELYKKLETNKSKCEHCIQI